MNWRLTIALLLALNGLLLGALLSRKTKPAQPAEPRPSPTTTARPPAAPRPVQQTLAATTATVVTNDFRWAQLESEDYRGYIQRLRGIGCPESTIRDIIIADLDRLFAPRLHALYPYREDLKYWEPEEEELINNIDDAAVLKQERALEQEKREVIKELTGADLASERLQKKGRESYYERRLQFLPEGQRSAVQQVLEDYHNQSWEIRQRQLDSGTVDSSDRTELQRLAQERDARLNELLSPDQRKTVDLWLSDTASQVRHDIYGMNATEQEFLKIYEARQQFDQQWNRDWVDLTDPLTQQRRDEAEAQMDQRLLSALGPQRFAEYKRGQDPEFHSLSAMIHRFGLTDEVAADVYNYRQAFLDYRDAIGYDGRLSPQQKEQTLAAIQEETRQALLDRLGKVAFNQYLPTADWLNN